MFQPFNKWLRTFISCLEELLIVFVVTVAGYTFLLYFLKMLWSVYCETQVGRTFTATNETVFNVINNIMHQNLLFFSFTISLTSITICLVCALASHLFFLKKYFYDSRGFIGRILFFGFPAAVITAFYIDNMYSSVYFAFCLLPTLALFSYCFKFVSYVIPAIDEIM